MEFPDKYISGVTVVTVGWDNWSVEMFLDQKTPEVYPGILSLKFIEIQKKHTDDFKHLMAPHVVPPASFYSLNRCKQTHLYLLSFCQEVI